MRNTRRLALAAEEYIEQIERYGDNPLVTGVLSGDTSFIREVEEFYDLSREAKKVSFLNFTRGFVPRESQSQKKGKCPADLVEILNGFSKKPIDSSKLQYNAVREDYQRLCSSSRSYKVSTLGMLIGLLGLGAGAISPIYGHYEITYPAVIVGMGGLILSFTSNNRESRRTNNEFNEYMKLHEAAEKADEFTERYYRINLS